MSTAALAQIRTTWNRGEVSALALRTCTLCAGLGIVHPRPSQPRYCGCVLRAIFRGCLERYRRLPARQGHGMSLAWKHLEYCADFELVARRELDAGDYRIFRLHFVDGMDWAHCAAQLNLSKGNFFHAVYRVEERLGRCFRELRPYGLWPLDLYFRGPNPHYANSRSYRP